MLYFKLFQGYRCSKLNCSDPDKCELQECSAHATCSEDEDPHECYCNPGFSGDGLICDNINECDDNSHNCTNHATCLDNMGSYSCQCQPGYTGDGIDCELSKCSTGTFTPDGITCEECHLNTFNSFQNAFLQECLPCPNHQTTENMGSTSITQCKCKYFLSKIKRT